MIVIGLVGLQQAGKSTTADYLVRRHGFQRGKFAQCLKTMLRCLLIYRGASEVDVERMIEGDLKEIPTPFLNGKTPRHAMQTLGTEWGRDCIDPDLWVDTEIARLSRNLTRGVVFDDVRYPNEALAIRKLGGKLWQVDRPGLPDTDEHDSERFRPNPDQVLFNGGRLGDLFAQVDAFLWGVRSEAA